MQSSLTPLPIAAFRFTLLLALITLSYLTTVAINDAIVYSFNDKVSHFLAFYTLAFLVDFSFPKQKFGLFKMLELLAYGLIIECIQYFLPYRSFSWYDLAANSAGLLAYKLSAPGIKYLYCLIIKRKENNSQSDKTQKTKRAMRKQQKHQGKLADIEKPAA